ncbi:hypothetical protein HDU67_003339 [Dinochytrium kinnereticum]|nr:hypothetical protein HDU67_003339 [Dinochytrium kinnereticum]
MLAKDFGVNRKDVLAYASSLSNAAAKGDRALLRSEQNLRDSLVPQYSQFFSQINHLPGGLKFLVSMRADLLRIIEKEENDMYLRALNENLKSLLQSWFGIGFLDLERLTWSTPASVLEKVIQYEAVHAIPSWQALKQRLGPARLCYSFFHRGMPLEPLTFIQVALLKDIEWDVQRILNDSSPDFSEPHLCKTAIFYSISSSQKGLAGVDLGNLYELHLIKRVVKEIQRDFPSVSTFCTLSPIPGFRSWLNTQFNLIQSGNHTEDKLLLDSEIETLRSIQKVDSRPAWEVLRDCLQTDEWHKKASKNSAFKPIMLRLCSRYLLLEKKRSFSLDPVANFHVRNGACVHRLNWMGDISAKGMEQSFGIMVNYVYVLPIIEKNNQQYLLDGTIPVLEPVSSTVQWAVQTGNLRTEPSIDFGKSSDEGVAKL